VPWRAVFPLLSLGTEKWATVSHRGAEGEMGNNQNISLHSVDARMVFCFQIVRSRCKEWMVCLRPHSAPLSTLPLNKSAKQNLCTTRHIAGLKNKSDALNLHSCDANRIQRLVLPERLAEGELFNLQDDALSFRIEMTIIVEVCGEGKDAEQNLNFEPIKCKTYLRNQRTQYTFM
jgi:hypothetical protein